MAEEFRVQETSVGEMHKRQEVMADGRRYIIYYTFGTDVVSDAQPSGDAGENTSEVPGNV
jgi:hypothetical protein